MAHEQRKSSTTCRKWAMRLTAAGVVIAAAVTLPAPFAMAQSTTSVLDKLNQLQAMLTDTAAKIASLLAAEDTTVLATSSGYKPEGYSGSCNVVNVGAATANVKISIITIEGAERVSVTVPIAPGRGNGVGQSVVDFSLQHHVWCKFEADVPKKNLRGVLQIVDFATGTPRFVTEAH